VINLTCFKYIRLFISKSFIAQTLYSASALLLIDLMIDEKEREKRKRERDV